MGDPLTPSLTPQIIVDDDEDSVPLYFLDEDAGIEETEPRTVVSMRDNDTAIMGNTFSTGLPAYKKALTSAIRKPSTASASSTASSSPSDKLKKLVRFLDRVEIVPAPRSFYAASTDQSPIKKQKLSPTSSKHSFYSTETFPDHEDDEILEEFDAGIAAGLGRAGSPNKSPSRSPSRSPNNSNRDLTIPTSSSSPPPDTFTTSGGYLTPPRSDIHSPPSPPPSWRIPPESLLGRQPHVRSPPRVRSPMRADEEIDLRVNEHCPSPSESADEDEEVRTLRPGVSYVVRRSVSPSTVPLHPVIARKMWRHGEIRFEDQWGRRLIPVGEKDSFQFDVWPVEEDAALEEGEGGSVRGAWVGGRKYRQANDR
ncbi:hypothetical protein BDD12DRAFT_808060 [Trichophaea hybrida]|nr:hypothetical protein BDD12DRAFT_808060 [Trichophaea hybrida]